jgi:hypothetical protein|nr:hypothetical protein [Propionibacterium sp.]
MLEIYVRGQLLRVDLERWLQRELDRARRSERGMSESVQNALFVVLAITIVGLLAVAITAFINRKIAVIGAS